MQKHRQNTATRQQKQKFTPGKGSQKPNLRRREFLPSIIGNRSPSKYAKQRQNTTEKHKATTKTKVRARKWITKTEPKKKSSCHPAKNRTALRPSADTKSDTGGGWERFAGKSALGSVGNASHACQALRFGSGPRRPPKKQPGAGSKTCVCKRDLRGQHAPPPVQKRSRTLCVRGPLQPSGKHKETRIIPRKWWNPIHRPRLGCPLGVTPPRGGQDYPPG